MTSPYATTVAMPMMSEGPNVPTARMSSPWYEAPVAVAYCHTPIPPWTRARATTAPATTAKSRRSRSRSTSAAGTSTNTWA